MISFQEFFESKSDLSFSFEFENELVNFNSKSKKELYCKVLDWLYDNGYDFEREKKQNKIFDKNKIEEIITNTNYRLDHFYNISGSNNFIKVLSPGTGYLNEGGMINNILRDLGCKNLKFSGDVIEEPSSNEIDKKMTFVEAAQYILKKNGNKPMTSYEVWDQSQDFTPKTGKTPWDTMNSQMILYSENSTAKNKKKNSLFRIIEGTRPYKFQLINPDLEVQSIPDEEIDLELPTKPSSFSLPEDEVIPFTHFRGVQAQEEREKPEPVNPVVSPFIDAICILGSSGKGKSYTTELILDSIPNLEYEFIIPSASTTNLLAQFSPGSERGGYVTSRLGKLIMKAHNNPSKNYVGVFDECHKANVIEMINDELLQCISTKRNKGRRFISLEQEIADLYTGLSDFRGNLLLPDNFGFVFLSSKPDVIISNADFFNRVDIYVMSQRPNEDSVEDAFDYSDGKIKLKEPYFKYFTNSEANQIKTEFDDANNKL